MSKTNVLVPNTTDQPPSPQQTSGVPTPKTFEVMVILTAKQGLTRWSPPSAGQLDWRRVGAAIAEMRTQ